MNGRAWKWDTEEGKWYKAEEEKRASEDRVSGGKGMRGEEGRR